MDCLCVSCVLKGLCRWLMCIEWVTGISCVLTGSVGGSCVLSEVSMTFMCIV